MVGYGLNSPNSTSPTGPPVVSIDECPSEIEGEGRLVTGRFEHSSAEVLNLYVEGEQTDPIGTTASHPFWSQDRQAFVSAELLRTTERLRLEDGRTAAVIENRATSR